MPTVDMMAKTAMSPLEFVTLYGLMNDIRVCHPGLVAYDEDDIIAKRPVGVETKVKKDVSRGHDDQTSVSSGVCYPTMDPMNDIIEF